MNAQIIPQLKPINNIRWNLKNGRWEVTGLPAQMELDFGQNVLPSGWILVRGRLRRFGQDFSANIIAETNDAVYTFPLPVTLKGTILELLLMPNGVKRLIIEPMRSIGEFELINLSIETIGFLERVIRMYQRILPIFWKYPRKRRLRAGLRWHTVFLSLRDAYSIAGRFRAYAPELQYETWIELYDKLTNHDRKAILVDIKRRTDLPYFNVVIIIDRFTSDGDIQRTVQSLQTQLYKNFCVYLYKTINFENEKKFTLFNGVRKADNNIKFYHSTDSSTWVVFLRVGDMLVEHALYWIASEISKNQHLGFLYADHDVIDKNGKRSNPVFKPDWSIELLRSTNYIDSAAVVRSDVLCRAGGISARDFDLHDIYLRVSEQIASDSIYHIPAILWHVYYDRAKTTGCSMEKSSEPVIAHLRRIGVSAAVERTEAGYFRIRYALPAQLPLVSIIIPTRDALQYLRPCVESILRKSTYRKIELLIVDNKSVDPAVLLYFKDLIRNPQVRILRYDLPFNYAAINNFAERHAKGDILCLLNNDTEVISSDWIEEMLGHLIQPGVGAVGAKLYFRNGRIQHAGDTVGPGGCAHHLHSGIERNAPGYCGRALVAQDLSAVTAACMMTHREIYRKLGGMDEQNLPVAFNDVDYCLRVREAGYRVVWTPHAELYHYESMTRGVGDNAVISSERKKEVNYMRNRWKKVMQHDPYYNPNLSYQRPDFSLSHAPLIVRPWEVKRRNYIWNLIKFES